MDETKKAIGIGLGVVSLMFGSFGMYIALSDFEFMISFSIVHQILLILVIGGSTGVLFMGFYIFYWICSEKERNVITK